MPIPYRREVIRTSTFRAPRWTIRDYIFGSDGDQIMTRMGHAIVRYGPRKVRSYPKPGWVDDYDSTGRHFSRRVWRQIVGSHARMNAVDVRQERRFTYRPKVVWSDNPASWDEYDDEEVTIEWQV